MKIKCCFCYELWLKLEYRKILKEKETNLNIKILESPNFISYEVSNKIFHVISQFAKWRTNIKNEFSVANFPHVQINFQIMQNALSFDSTHGTLDSIASVNLRDFFQSFLRYFVKLADRHWSMQRRSPDCYC